MSLIAESAKSFSKLNMLDIAILQEFQIKHKGVFTRPNKFITWTKPPTGWYKLNCDESFRGNPGTSGGGGGIIRDYNCRMMATSSSFFGNGTNNSVKLKAKIKGIWLCKLLQYFNIFLKVRIVVDWIWKGRCTTWYLWDFWEDLVTELKGVNFMVIHQYRKVIVQ